jgi:catechol 2,3-dioxygenase-like lactoylglutathione lyase family enzyme
MDGTSFHFGLVRPSARFQPTKNRGLHFCFEAPDAAAVDAFHATALRAGGHDNGAPGLRPIYGPDYYAAFIIDPDGYRIEAYYGPGEM